MSYNIDLQWIIFAEMTEAGLSSLNSSNLLFNQRSGKSLIKQIGGKIRTSYAPVVLEPTHLFHRALHDIKVANGLSGKKFPYDVANLFGTSPNRLNINIHLHGKFLCIIAALDSFEVNEIAGVREKQSLKNYPNLSAIILKTLAVAMTGESRSEPLKNLPKYYPATRIVSNTGEPENLNETLVEIITRHAMPLPRVVDSVLNKNLPHQVDRSLLLVDRQGVLAYVPSNSRATAQGNLQRFRNATAMLELAGFLDLQLTKNLRPPGDLQKIIVAPENAIPGSVSSQNAWILMTQEFHLPSRMTDITSNELISSPSRILLITVTNVESRAVLSVFERESGRKSQNLRIDGFVYQELGHVAGHDVFLAISEMGAGGKSGSQETVRKAILAINPTTVIMVGIAFGIDDSKYRIGDILVSKQLLLYDLQRINSDASITLRGDKASASPTALNWVRHAAVTWDEPKVELGLVLTGDKLVDNRDFREDLKKCAPEALGGEMEGAGLYIACEQENVAWILIKAICDWADGNKSANKSENQQLAAENAAAFVLHVLKTSGT
jgi:nucleoside phosphorylase